MFEYQYKALVKEDFRVIGITLRGFGKSDKPDGAYNYDVHAGDIKKVLDKLDIEDAVLGCFSIGGAIAIRYVSTYNGAHVSKLALFGAAAPIWTQRDDFPFNLPISAVDDLIALNDKDRSKLISDFTKIFSATETSLNEKTVNWMKEISMSSSGYAMGQCLIALRDTDLRNDLANIKIPTVIMHGKKDKICSFDLAEQMKNGIRKSYIRSEEHTSELQSL